MSKFLFHVLNVPVVDCVWGALPLRACSGGVSSTPQRGYISQTSAPDSYRGPPRADTFFKWSRSQYKSGALRPRQCEPDDTSVASHTLRCQGRVAPTASPQPQVRTAYRWLDGRGRQHHKQSKASQAETNKRANTRVADTQHLALSVLLR